MSVTLANTPVIETERLRLRAPVAADWPAWRDMALSERARFITAPGINEQLAWRAFGHLVGHWVMRGFGMFIITRHGDDTGIGMCGPRFPAGWPEPELGYAIWTPEAEGKGIAFEAMTAVRAHAYGALGWTTAVSFIDPENTRSIALARRLGATVDPDGHPPVLPAAPVPGEPPETPPIVFRHPGPEAVA